MNKLLKITMVIDTYGVPTNGTTISSMRFAEALRDRGHTVNILTGSPANDEFTYTTGYVKIPGLYQITKSQGMYLAKSNKNVLMEAIKESDIVHFLLPFKIQKDGLKLADKLNIPSSAAFHLQPENITSTLYLEKFKVVNEIIYGYFKRYYDKFSHIHCPSTMIANKLTERDYKSKLHVISNGVDSKFVPEIVAKPNGLEDKFIILMVGRLSREKRQDLIIKAVKKLDFEKDVQIIFAGDGPWKHSLKEESKGLTNEPIMQFFQQDVLLDIINYSDLYVHASDTEIEAISCIEAFSCGLVPIISNSTNSATNQFALTDDNLFNAGDESDLANKITSLRYDSDLLDNLSKEYVKYAEAFQLRKSVDALELMFYETIKDYNGNSKL